MTRIVSDFFKDCKNSNYLKASKTRQKNKSIEYPDSVNFRQRLVQVMDQVIQFFDAHG